MLPALATHDSALDSYLAEIRRIPFLTAEEEYMLSRRYAETQDPDAAERLVNSHLRLVAKVAMGYRGYGLPVGDLIAEGNLGLLHAVKKFDPERGFRLATYAMWWIRSNIHDYLLRSWSVVKLGTTAGQKKLFFNLRKMKEKLAIMDDRDLSDEKISQIAKELNVTSEEVVRFNGLMGGREMSLDAPISTQDGDIGTRMDVLTSDQPTDVEVYDEGDEHSYQVVVLNSAIECLPDRDRDIFRRRRMQEVPDTLEVISTDYSISRERVRQIENRAFERVQQSVRASILE
ncbi:MAG: RNA polymerase sigma factor RpoH [Alphaproteobacteria bacterium]|nr:RNA polymerase sigma factor RpoH [Alphaproteobacteria bacterium]